MRIVKRVRNRSGSVLRCVLAFALAFAMMGVAAPGALADEGAAREQATAASEASIDAAVASVDGAETADAEEDVAVGETEAVVGPPSAIKEAQTADDSEVAAAQDVLSAGVQVMAPPNMARNQYILYNACMGTNGHQCFIIQPLVNGTAALGGNWQAMLRIDDSSSYSQICLWPANGAERRFGDIGFRQTLTLTGDSRYVKIVFDIVNYGTESHKVDMAILKKNDYFKEMRETSTGAYGIFEYGGQSYIYNFAAMNSYGLGKPSVVWFSPTNFGTSNYWEWIFEGSPETSTRPNQPVLGKSGDSGWEVGLTWLDHQLAPGGTMQLAFEIGACGYGVQPELSSDIEAVVKGGRIDISAEVKDSEGALDRLLCVTDPYTADAGAIKEIGRTEGTGEFVPLDGTFPLPPTWNVGEVHSVEMWVENDAGLKSASTTVNILVVENEDGSDVMVPATPVQVVFGEGDDAQVVDTFEQAVIPIPDGPADVPEGKKFAGWQDPEGDPWNPGSEWTVPSGVEDGEVRFEPVWVDADAALWHKEVYEQQLDGTYVRVSSQPNASTEGAQVSFDLAAESVPRGFVVNQEKSVASGVVAADGSTVLALYLDRARLQVVLDHCVVDDASPAAASALPSREALRPTKTEAFEVVYGSTLADIDRVSLPDSVDATFGGWFTERGGNGVEYGAQKQLKQDGLTLYALWVSKKPADPYVTVTSENVTHPDGPNQVGDKVKVTVEAGNRSPDNPWPDVVLIVDVPTGLTIDPDSLRVLDGEGNPVPDIAAVWDPETRTVTADLGDVAPDSSYTVDYDAVVSPEAVYPGGDTGTSAEAGGANPDGTPNGEVTAGPAYPGGGASSDEGSDTDPGDSNVVPLPAQPMLTKEAANLDRTDEVSRVGDTVRYTIRASAGVEGAQWLGVVVTDDVPKDLEVLPETVTLQDSEGRKLPGAQFDAQANRVTAHAGDLYGTRAVTLQFDARILPSAAGTLSGSASAEGQGATVPDIGNRVQATGTDGVSAGTGDGGGSGDDPAGPGEGDGQVDAVTDKVYPSEQDRPENGGVANEDGTRGDSGNGGGNQTPGGQTPGEGDGLGDGAQDGDSNGSGLGSGSGSPAGTTGSGDGGKKGTMTSLGAALAQTDDPVGLLLAGCALAVLLASVSTILARRRRA